MRAVGLDGRGWKEAPMLVGGLIVGLFVVGLFFSMLTSSPRAGR